MNSLWYVRLLHTTRMLYFKCIRNTVFFVFEVTSFILYFLGLIEFISNYKSFYNHVHWLITGVIYTPRINNDNSWLRYQKKTFRKMCVFP